jgi:hypothetical protein
LKIEAAVDVNSVRRGAFDKNGRQNDPTPMGETNSAELSGFKSQIFQRDPAWLDSRKPGRDWPVKTH